MTPSPESLEHKQCHDEAVHHVGKSLEFVEEFSASE
jgi:hypothetical protein